MKKLTFLSISVVLLIFSIAVSSQTPDRTFLPLDVDVPFPPSPVKFEGKTHFLYELHITNFGPSDVTLQSIEVFGKGNSAQSLGINKDKSLEDLIYQAGTIPRPKDPKDKNVISGGKRVYITLWLTIETDNTVPSQLIHHLSVQFPNNLAPSSEGKIEMQEQVLEAGLVKVRPFNPPVLGPPVESGEWVAIPHNISGRPVIAWDGKARVAQRYAMDLMKFGPDGKLVSDKNAENENYYGFGAKLIAVADGVVSYALDGEPENIPKIGPKRETLTRKNFAGNVVILDIGDGIYAVYAHIKKDSIVVKVGDRVKKGQVLAELGNTGNSGGPHLHFHVVDQNMILAAEGIPYVYESFEIMRKLDANDAEKIFTEQVSWKSGEIPKPDRRKKEIPVDFCVIRFSETPKSR